MDYRFRFSRASERASALLGEAPSLVNRSRPNGFRESALANFLSVCISVCMCRCEDKSEE